MNKENIFGGELLLETGTNEIQLVEFVLRGQSFGVNVDKIQQIIEKPEVTIIPEENPIIYGIFEFREEVIPLIDLRKCLVFNENNGSSADSARKVIVMDFNKTINGFMVDDVKKLHRLSWNRIEPPNIAVEKGYELYAVGFIKFEDRICIMVDFEKIISTLNPELSIRHLPAIEYSKSRGNKRILFAEDSQHVRKEIHDILSSAGFRVTAVENGAEAFRILEAAAEKVDKGEGKLEEFINLVITDIEMPRMDGRHLTRKIKEHPVLKRLPVFLFTSMSGMWSQTKAKTIGADGLISKPEIHSVVSRLDEVVL